MFIPKNREQIIEDAKKKSESMNENHQRLNALQEQEIKKNNQTHWN